MAPEGSDRDDDDAGDHTHLGIRPPPQVKPAAPAPAAPAPATPAPATPAAPTGDDTGRGVAAPPPLPQPPKPAAPAPSVEADEEGTVIVTRTRTVTATLQRLQPPGRSETIRLDRTSYLLGRSHKCDLLLYSPNASREHARLTFRDGAWHIQPVGDKEVLADGAPIREDGRLTHKMSLQLGGDELLFLAEGADPPTALPARPTPAAVAAPPPRAEWFVTATIVLLLVAAALWWWIAG